MLMARLLLALAFVLASSAQVAFAFEDETPCGPFALEADEISSCDMSTGGECLARCSPLSYQAAASGVCTAVAEPACVELCQQDCASDCFAFACFEDCHEACDQTIQALCEAEGSGADCQVQGQVQCDVHCESACEVQPEACADSCAQACDGACRAESNFECDVSRFAALDGTCRAHCGDGCNSPGGIFCDAQFVDASNVEACAQYIVDQGIEVDVSIVGTLCGEEAEEGEGCGCVVGASGSRGYSSAALAILLGLTRRTPRRRR